MSLSFKALAAQSFTLYYSITTRVICNRHAFAHKCLGSRKRLTRFNPDGINSQARALILSQFQEEDHPFIRKDLQDEHINVVSLYYVYKPKTDTPRTKNMKDDENAYKLGPKYGGEFSGLHRHMISVVVFYYSETLKSMLIEYVATEMGFIDDYYDSDPNHKSIRGNGITTFLFHVAQCIIFNLKNQVKTIFIAIVSLMTFYSRLVFSVIKDFATSTSWL